MTIAVGQHKNIHDRLQPSPDIGINQTNFRIWPAADRRHPKPMTALPSTAVGHGATEIARRMTSYCWLPPRSTLPLGKIRHRLLLAGGRPPLSVHLLTAPHGVTVGWARKIDIPRPMAAYCCSLQINVC